jgi:hypothetical protein
MKITVSVKNAPSIIAGFVKEGLTFDAYESRDGLDIIIELTGGF